MMKISKHLIVLTLTLSISSSVLADGKPWDYYKGGDAYAAGDYKKAMEIWLESAQNGNELAQFSVGKMFYYGEGVVKNYAFAMKWYRLSAKQGNSSAQFMMAMMYKNGRGVVQDNIRAYMWYSLASANDFFGAGNRRDNLESSMSSDDVSRAQAMASECMSSGYEDCGE